MSDGAAVPLRAAVIGCGFFAPNHLHAWAEMAGVSVVAVCDLDGTQAKSVAAAFAIPAVFTDAEAMLREVKPDFVDIVTQMGSHRELVELCMRHRVPAIVQKPFAPSYQDAAAMVEAARRAALPLMVHENFRFQQPMRQVKAVLDGGTIGDATWARLSFRTGYDVKGGQPYLCKEERFVVLDLGIHVLDLARFLLGEVDTVYSRHQRIDARCAGEDMATIMLGHTSGATSVVEVTYESRRLPDTFPETLVTIEGTRGAVELKHGFVMAVSANGSLTETNVATPLRPWTSEPWHTAQDSVFHTEAHWANCLRTGQAPETSGEDNLKTYALVEASYASAASGQAIRVADLVARLAEK